MPMESQADPADAALADRIATRLDRLGMLSNGLGALVVALFLAFLAPRTLDAGDYKTLLLRATPVFIVYMAITLPLGRATGRRRFAVVLQWLRSGRAATDREREVVLTHPRAFARIAAVFWAIASIVFSLVVLSVAPVAAPPIAIAIALGGATACALQYLLVERTLRPVTARALAGGSPPRRRTPGVAARLTMAWTLATGVPLVGIIAFAVADLAGADFQGGQVVGSALFLACLALVVGLAGMLVAARSVADPVASVQHALERVEEGDLEARVAVDDGSEVGLLEAGFNRMVAGLAERERLRDLFGRHVGRDVARAALDGEVRLGGEVRDVAVLFVDLVGSTTLATERPPTEVVEVLNEFFRIVVGATERHGGWVNKFEGDAALCVFGAPVPTEDPAGCALGAARELRDRIADELPGVEAGIGVSAGPAVAGNVGTEQRYEYTVIGDPVNEAARLCELAKQRPERVLGSEAAIARARDEEARRWSLGDAVVLRGRGAPTRLATVPG